MIYPHVVKATFIDRPNRFIAHVRIDGAADGAVETVHVKNTGRCRELLIPGVKVILSDGWTDEERLNPDMPHTRKTRYDLITVYKENLGWINIDSQVPNKVVMEWLQSNSPSRNALFSNPIIKPEYTYGDSRVDFYVKDGDRNILIEVKGCTLEVDGVGYFPDAPTTRGVKHLNELAGAIDSGYETYILYVIAMPGITKVLPNGKTDPSYEVHYKKATQKGVKTLYMTCDITPNEIRYIDVNLF